MTRGTRGTITILIRGIGWASSSRLARFVQIGEESRPHIALRLFSTAQIFSRFVRMGWERGYLLMMCRARDSIK